eukprot:TRINITY_DN5096_c0_g1_i1.p1 TRINITY_DN5096_c0_g1~~TRINITY_DN5096_c0_g1_i1.p1  ORF type:complete len:1563 (-),score=325.95 TRINITY_DN5096_c0_g1_i1:176-4864(-)
MVITDTRLFTFGCGVLGELGWERGDDSSYHPEATPVSFPKLAAGRSPGEEQASVSAVALGSDHSLAIVAGRVFRWGLLCHSSSSRSTQRAEGAAEGAGGQGYLSEVSSGGVVPFPAPMKEWCCAGKGGVASGDEGGGGDSWQEGPDGFVHMVAAGGSNSFMLTSHGEVFAFGQLRSLGGDPAHVRHLWGSRCGGPASRVRQVAAGWRHCLLLTEAGCVFAFGDDEHGQCAGCSNGQVALPIPAAVHTAGIAAGACHSVAWCHRGIAFSWGHGGAGRLGLGSTGHRRCPAQIDALSDVPVLLARCGANFTIFVSGLPAGVEASSRHGSQVTLWACGGNQYGQLGLGELKEGASQVHVPRALRFPLLESCTARQQGIHGMVSVEGLACGANHVLCLARPPGQRRLVVWAWGSSAFGQCGCAAGQASGDVLPQRRKPMALADFLPPQPHWPVAVAAGRAHSAVLARCLGASVGVDDELRIGRRGIDGSAEEMWDAVAEAVHPAASRSHSVPSLGARAMRSSAAELTGGSSRRIRGGLNDEQDEVIEDFCASLFSPAPLRSLASASPSFEWSSPDPEPPSQPLTRNASHVELLVRAGEEVLCDEDWHASTEPTTFRTKTGSGGSGERRDARQGAGRPSAWPLVPWVSTSKSTPSLPSRAKAPPKRLNKGESNCRTWPSAPFSWMQERMPGRSASFVCRSASASNLRRGAVASAPRAGRSSQHTFLPSARIPMMQYGRSTAGSKEFKRGSAGWWADFPAYSSSDEDLAGCSSNAFYRPSPSGLSEAKKHAGIIYPAAPKIDEVPLALPQQTHPYPLARRPEVQLATLPTESQPVTLPHESQLATPPAENHYAARSISDDRWNSVHNVLNDLGSMIAGIASGHASHAASLPDFRCGGGHGAAAVVHQVAMQDPAACVRPSTPRAAGANEPLQRTSPPTTNASTQTQLSGGDVLSGAGNDVDNSSAGGQLDLNWASGSRRNKQESTIMAIDGNSLGGESDSDSRHGTRNRSKASASAEAPSTMTDVCDAIEQGDATPPTGSKSKRHGTSKGNMDSPEPRHVDRSNLNRTTSVRQEHSLDSVIQEKSKSHFSFISDQNGKRNASEPGAQDVGNDFGPSRVTRAAPDVTIVTEDVDDEGYRDVTFEQDRLSQHGSKSSTLGSSPKAQDALKPGPVREATISTAAEGLDATGQEGDSAVATIQVHTPVRASLEDSQAGAASRLNLQSASVSQEKLPQKIPSLATPISPTPSPIPRQGEVDITGLQGELRPFSLENSESSGDDSDGPKSLSHRPGPVVVGGSSSATGLSAARMLAFDANSDGSSSDDDEATGAIGPLHAQTEAGSLQVATATGGGRRSSGSSSGDDSPRPPQGDTEAGSLQVVTAIDSSGSSSGGDSPRPLQGHTETGRLQVATATGGGRRSSGSSSGDDSPRPLQGNTEAASLQVATAIGGGRRSSGSSSGDDSPRPLQGNTEAASLQVATAIGGGRRSSGSSSGDDSPRPPQGNTEAASLQVATATGGGRRSSGSSSGDDSPRPPQGHTEACSLQVATAIGGGRRSSGDSIGGDSLSSIEV